MERYFNIFVNVILTVLKATTWLILRALYVVLELMKIFLLLLCMVGRIFISFVRAGTPM